MVCNDGFSGNGFGVDFGLELISSQTSPAQEYLAALDLWDDVDVSPVTVVACDLVEE
jgi:hypothetical protein